jgi:hypothetical protein
MSLWTRMSNVTFFFTSDLCIKSLAHCPKAFLNLSVKFRCSNLLLTSRWHLLIADSQCSSRNCLSRFYTQRPTFSTPASCFYNYICAENSLFRRRVNVTCTFNTESCDSLHPSQQGGTVDSGESVVRFLQDSPLPSF